jgi:hypothetical protein
LKQRGVTAQELSRTGRRGLTGGRFLLHRNLTLGGG